MITDLKKRQRVDDIKNDIRKPKPDRWGRIIYLTLILGLCLQLAHYAFGEYIFFRTEGLVVANPHSVSASFVAHVESVFVQPGDLVKAGQKIAKLDSISLVRQIAELSTQIADLTNKIVQMKTEQKFVENLLPIARQQSKNSDLTVSSVEKLRRRSLATADRVEDAARRQYDANFRLATLETKSIVAEEQYGSVITAYDQAVHALNKLKRLYNDGNVFARVDGQVGAKTPIPGQVSVIGEPLLTIYEGKQFIMAYVPEKLLFRVSEGQKVGINMGSETVNGTIEKLLPVAAVLPPELQSKFKPVNRSRLMRISLPENHSFALLQKVEITACWMKWC